MKETLSSNINSNPHWSKEQIKAVKDFIKNENELLRLLGSNRITFQEFLTKRDDLLGKNLQ